LLGSEAVSILDFWGGSTPNNDTLGGGGGKSEESDGKEVNHVCEVFFLKEKKTI
jgi:hypothetical protein